MMQVVVDALKIMVTFLFEKAALGTTFYWGSKIANGNNRQSTAPEKIANGNNRQSAAAEKIATGNNRSSEAR